MICDCQASGSCSSVTNTQFERIGYDVGVRHCVFPYCGCMGVDVLSESLMQALVRLGREQSMSMVSLPMTWLEAASEDTICFALRAPRRVLPIWEG